MSTATKGTIDIGDILSNVLRDAPKLAVERLLREKLQKMGVKARKSSIRRVAEQILSGVKGTVSFGEKAADAADIEITQVDLDTVFKRLEKFSEVDLPKIIEGVGDRTANDLYTSLKKKWAQEHRHQNTDLARFRKNLELRYGEGLGKLRMLATIAREWGQENYQRKFARCKGTLSNLDDVLIRLHVRACQVVLEIITLLETGLADGAIARWRTLHEITTVAMFIERHGEETAQRYVHYQIVESKKAMTAYEECRKDLGYGAYSKKQAAKITKEYARVIAKYGKPFGGEYGWAAHLIGQGPKKKVTFANLQNAVGMKQMRAHYQMASYNVHASPKGVYFKLGEMEKSTVLLAGSSNAGLVEPAQNAALSLSKLTIIACNDRDAPPFDNYMFAKIVNRLMWEIPQDFARADRLLKREHKAVKSSEK